MARHRVDAAIYAVGTLAAWLLPTAVGANADRLGGLPAGTVLIGLAEPRRLLPAGSAATRRALSLLALAGAAAWLAAGIPTGLTGTGKLAATRSAVCIW